MRMVCTFLFSAICIYNLIKFANGISKRNYFAESLYSCGFKHHRFHINSPNRFHPYESRGRNRSFDDNLFMVELHTFDATKRHKCPPYIVLRQIAICIKRHITRTYFFSKVPPSSPRSKSYTLK